MTKFDIKETPVFKAEEYLVVKGSFLGGSKGYRITPKDTSDPDGYEVVVDEQELVKVLGGLNSRVSNADLPYLGGTIMDGSLLIIHCDDEDCGELHPITDGAVELLSAIKDISNYSISVLDDNEIVVSIEGSLHNMVVTYIDLVVVSSIHAPLSIKYKKLIRGTDVVHLDENRLFTLMSPAPKFDTELYDIYKVKTESDIYAVVPKQAGKEMEVEGHGLIKLEVGDVEINEVLSIVNDGIAEANIPYLSGTVLHGPLFVRTESFGDRTSMTTKRVGILGPSPDKPSKEIIVSVRDKDGEIFFWDSTVSNEPIYCSYMDLVCLGLADPAVLPGLRIALSGKDAVTKPNTLH